MTGIWIDNQFFRSQKDAATFMGCSVGMLQKMLREMSADELRKSGYNLIEYDVSEITPLLAEFRKTPFWAEYREIGWRSKDFFGLMRNAAIEGGLEFKWTSHTGLAKYCLAREESLEKIGLVIEKEWEKSKGRWIHWYYVKELKEGVEEDTP